MASPEHWRQQAEESLRLAEAATSRVARIRYIFNAASCLERARMLDEAKPLDASADVSAFARPGGFGPGVSGPADGRS